MIKKESKNKVRSRKHLRVRAKVSGTSATPRLCVFRSNKHIEAQVIDDVKQVTLVSVSSLSLHLENGSNIAAASKVGEEVAKVISELTGKDFVTAENQLLNYTTDRNILYIKMTDIEITDCNYFANDLQKENLPVRFYRFGSFH